MSIPKSGPLAFVSLVRLKGTALKHDNLQAFVATLTARDQLSDRERDVLLALPWRRDTVTRHSEFVELGDTLSDSTLLIEGWCGRVSFMRNGSRQITGLNIPGDFVDLPSFFLRTLDHSVVAITDCTIARVSHDALRQLSVEEPHLWRLFTILIAIEGAVHRMWILNLGRRSPPHHLAHLICEVRARLAIIGRDLEEGFALPLTQAELADLLGISIVHTNRSMKQLREIGLIRRQGASYVVSNWDDLHAYADFDPTYLNVFRAPR